LNVTVHEETWPFTSRTVTVSCPGGGNATGPCQTVPAEWFRFVEVEPTATVTCDTATLSEADTLTNTLRPATPGRGPPPQPTHPADPGALTPRIIGLVRSANGGFRRRIQKASQLKKNVAPWPSQSFRLYSE